MARNEGKLAILVGGGPAPGINSVIAAASIRANLKGNDVLGIEDGFRWIMKGDVSRVQPLTIETVSRIHFRGGSQIGTARDNPTKSPQLLDAVIESLRKLGVDKLITIGGDDTAYSALKVEERACGRIRVVHVPKTIDNDLDLPHGVNTFGYQTARHVGAGLVKNLMIDAKTTSRWYFVISMGRKAGHLALGIGKAAGATVTIIPEEFSGETIRLKHIADILVGSIIKRTAEGRHDGVAVLAEGLIERLDARDLETFAQIERDEHDHIKLGEIHFAPVIKKRVAARLREIGLTTSITALDVGYELRCAEPIPYDMEYTRDLGFCAAQFIINGGTGAMVTIEDGCFKPLYFKELLDPQTGRTRVRMISMESEYYFIARRYMIRLNRMDFEEPHLTRRLADVCGMSPERFHEEFSYVIDEDVLSQLHRRRRHEEHRVEDVTFHL